MTSSSNFKAEYLAYAFHCIAAKSDEDRFSASMNHAKSGMRNLASFGIFDGHMGVRFILLKGVLKLLHCHAFNFHPPKCSMNHLILFNKATCAEECSTQLHDTMAMNYKNLLNTTNQKLNGMYILSFLLKSQTYDRAAVLKS